MEDGKGFVIADIPGLIEGASEGVGLGHEFLRHIERTKVMIHMVDAASEQKDVIQSKTFYAINRELEAYNPELVRRNRRSLLRIRSMPFMNGENEIIEKLRENL